MSAPAEGQEAQQAKHATLFDQLRRRGVLRVAVSYAVIGWLLLQIGDVVLEPLDAPAWTMRALIIFIATGFPIALALAWYFELGPGGITLDHLPEESARPATRGLRRHADAIVIGVLLAVIVLLLARQGGLLEPEAGPPVLAVLPFTEIGGGDGTWFGDGLSDTMIHKLGQVSGLVVLASTSTFEFRGADQDLATVARKLGASAVLLGSLQRAGGVLRVNARLVNAGTGQQQWTASFDRQASDLFAVQDEIAEAVTAALRVVLAPHEEERLARHDTDDLAAYDAYVRGREGIAARTVDSMTQAITNLRQATEIDPEFALAHAALAEAYFLATTYSAINWPWDQTARTANEAAARAQALDPALGEAWLAQAFVAMGDNQNVLVEQPWPDEYIRSLLQKATELSPNNAQAWRFLSAYSEDPQTRLPKLQQAARLDPRSGIVLENLGSAYRNGGDLEQARRMYLRSLDTARPLFELGLMSLVETYSTQVSDLATAARWAHYGHELTAGQFGGSWREYCFLLLELGDWEEMDRQLALAEGPVKTASGSSLLYRVGMRARLMRARGDPGVADQAARFLQAVEETFKGPRQELHPDSPPSSVLNILALDRLRHGDPGAALRHFDSRYPQMPQMSPAGGLANPMSAFILRLATLKQLGQGEEARRQLRDYLGRIEALPLNGPDGVGFVPFSLHAFLGETDAAIEAFEQAVQTGWFQGWWVLKDGAFDPDYAAVLADARFQRTFSQLEAAIREQREAFHADPGLPVEDLVLAGLEEPQAPR